MTMRPRRRTSPFHPYYRALRRFWNALDASTDEWETDLDAVAMRRVTDPCVLKALNKALRTRMEAARGHLRHQAGSRTC